MEIIIEISKGSNLKYEYDIESNKLILDRVLNNTNVFPYNYGFIPNTLSPDGDPIDIILLSKHSLIPGTYVNVRVIGIVRTEDEAGIDDKIVCVLDSKIDKEYELVNDIENLNANELKNILYFLSHYKDGEDNKFVKVGEVKGKKEAFEYINTHSLE
tara:strand:- start:1466 stop:1936 length:471 start_codon:yes stop_codon:yes gene_type:complete